MLLIGEWKVSIYGLATTSDYIELVTVSDTVSPRRRGTMKKHLIYGKTRSLKANSDKINTDTFSRDRRCLQWPHVSCEKRNPTLSSNQNGSNYRLSVSQSSNYRRLTLETKP